MVLNIKCILTPPLNLRSNGAVENQFDKVKRTLLNLLCDEKYSRRKYSLHHIDCLLLKSRTTPNSGTQRSPIKYLLKKTLKTSLEILTPSGLESVGSQKNFKDKSLYFIKG